MRLYLSSTLDDLKDERQAVKDVLGRHYAIVESYEAAPRSLWASCVDDVRSCDLYVGIVGLRYGFVPPGQHKSITELEFEAALSGKPDCYLFVKDATTAANSLADHFTKENHPALIEAFRARLSSGANGIPRPGTFKTADDLKVLVLQSVPRPAPGDAERPEPDRGDTAPPPPPAMSELQKMLWEYLQKNWSGLSTQRAFTGAELFSELAESGDSLSAAKVFERARYAPAADVLVETRSFFDERVARGASPWTSGLESDDTVCSAIARIALVAAERYVRQKCDEDASVRPDYEPVASSDQLVACIEAATRLGFGLRFSAGKRQPDNVFPIVHPVAELGVRDEEGLALSRSELLATIERREVNPGEDHDVDYLHAFFRSSAKKLGAGLVVSSHAAGRFDNADRRAELQDYLKQTFGVRSFFTRQANEETPQWVKRMENDLRHTFDRIFTLPSPQTATQENKMPEKEPSQSAPAAGTHVTNIFHGQVGSVAQANAAGAQAAARDFVNAPQGADLLQALAAVQQAIEACRALPAQAEQGARLLADLSEVRDVLQANGRSPSDAKLVKRCLDGLEEGAKAVNNGGTITAALAPVWDGLKNTWPAFLTLFN